ncbi:alpha-amylase family glycosyl hydrolase [Solirubrobacter soli]|uniref:alpha-amylase family glycosyl hydrolase n=1 Tax=Solirubrobacter soli TaxID=363832 RepID=UPI00041E9AC5|nr:malto-oligosyltrehalose synthase [Solirubrobacter soli]
MTDFRATYRLQLGPGFGFAEAAALVPYLARLGVSHVYLPPSFQAREGSTHGYDVVDPSSISRELGGQEAFDALVAAVREAGMGIVLDIVPNHMATDPANRFWADRALRTKFFDIDEVTGRHRRFFDVDELAALRQEDPEVFAATHSLALRLVSEGVVDGLRIDHPDGLADPAGYLARLRDGGVEHVWVEKILDPGEPLRDWPVEGTVGYEFLNDVCALFVDPSGEAPLTDLWVEISGDDRRFGDWAFEAKLEQARTTFAPEVERLLRDAPSRVTGLERALASFPVYRTYVEPWTGRVEAEDRRAIEEAGLSTSMARVLELETPGWDAFVTRFQQTTPPVMAKGVEDTAFYRYARLLALNDVGGNPSRFSMSVDAFHAANAARPPKNLLVTQTHDTKRSGDVRARIGALAGMADEFAAHTRTWLNACRSLTAGGAPTPAEQHFIFQTLLGVWPISPERLEQYLMKAMREAKQHTTWIAVNEAHEEAVQRFARALLTHRDFLRDFLPFQERVAEAGDRAALGQLLLKLTVPGVPDIYQGDELLRLSLVDPDNRREVDWDERRAALEDPPPKLDLILRALGLRAERPEVFAGSYAPLAAGPDAIAFVRGEAVVAGVLLRGEPVALTLPPGDWRDVLGERTVSGTLTLDGLALLSRL